MKPIIKDTDYLTIKTLLINSTIKIPISEKLQIEEKIKNSRIVKEKNYPSETIGLGSQVELFDLNSSIKNKLILVHPEDAQIKNQKISVLAPLAIALMGHQEGEIVQWKTPRGSLRLKIMKVSQLKELV